MKIYLSFDFEGLGGVASFRETEKSALWNDLAQRQLCAFLEGVREGDPEADILVSDSHSAGDNLYWDKLPPGVRLIRGYPRTYYMMEGLDATYAKLVLFGYHAGIGEAGMMDHTYSLSSLFQAKANGVVLDEALINAYYAGTYDVPLCFVFGDQTCVDRLRPLAGGADYLPSKKAVSRFSGEMVPYNELLASLKAKGKALKDVQGQVLALKGRIKAEFTMTDTLRAYLAAMVPGVSLKEPRKIGFKASDFREFYRYLQTIVTVCASAKSL